MVQKRRRSAGRQRIGKKEGGKDEDGESTESTHTAIEGIETTWTEEGAKRIVDKWWTGYEKKWIV